MKLAGAIYFIRTEKKFSKKNLRKLGYKNLKKQKKKKMFYGILQAKQLFKTQIFLEFCSLSFRSFNGNLKGFKELLYTKLIIR